MPSKLTKEIVNERLKDKKVELIGKYRGIYKKTTFRCEKEHVWETTPAVIFNGKKCPLCLKKEKFLTKIEVNRRLSQRDIILINKYTHSQIKHEFECLKCGNIWAAVPNDIFNGRGCPICSLENRRLSIEEINKRLAPKNIKLIGEYKGIDKKTKFKCNKGHIIENSLNNILRIEKCPICNGNIIKQYNNKEDKKNYFNKKLEEENRNIILIGEYINSSTKTTFQCYKGHIWQGIPNLISKGIGCPECAKHKKLTKEIVNKRLENRNIELIGEYYNVMTKTLFRCKENHEWKSTTDNILRGKGCPICAKYGFNPNKSAVLYYLNILGTEYYKIGITNRTITKRFNKDLDNIEIIKEILFENGIFAHKIEQKILKKYKQFLYKGPPILKSGGNSEIFIKDIFEGNYEQINNI